MAKKLFLIDGSGFIFRAYHALPPLTRKDGTPVGAVYGFCAMLARLIIQHGANPFLVAFDAGRQTFRQSIYPDYKAHRPDAPDDLIPQFPLFRESCQAFGVPYVEQAGFEADDLIASYARRAESEGYEVVIVSSDKDLMQLVGPSISLLDPIKNKAIGPNEVKEKFGVEPALVIDVQALAGDSSDNVPGVPGVGIKTAAELINSFGSLEKLLANANTIKQPKRRESLVQNAELARISKKLVTLVDNLEPPIAITDLIINLDKTVCREFLEAQGFHSLVKRFEGEGANGILHSSENGLSESSPLAISSASLKVPEFVTIRDIQTLDHWINRAFELGSVVIDLETTSLSIMEASLVGVAMALIEQNEVRAAYVPLAHQDLTPQINRTEALEKLKPLLEHPAVTKIGHNLKYDCAILKNYGLSVVSVDDTMLMSCCLFGGLHNHGMDELSRKYLDYTPVSFGEVTGTGKKQVTFDYVDTEKATAYAAEDAFVTAELYKVFKIMILERKKTVLYESVEKPLIDVVANMERRGVGVNIPYLKTLGREFTQKMEDLQKEIFILSGRAFNIASPKQLGEVLFDELKLPAPKKSKTGAFVTDADVLEKLALQGYTVAEKILQWRSFAKLNSTYVEGLIEAQNDKTRRIHTSYNLAATSTGRLSSSDPNLQNIPIRTEEGRKIRKAFIPGDGFTLVSFDYSQIELRLLAHMADVPPLVEAFKGGEDIHKSTASLIFGVPLNEVSGELRRKAKAVNFGIIYGISAFGLAQQLGCGNSEAAEIIKSYFQKYGGIQDYMEHQKSLARSQGFVTTIMDRPCYTPFINDKNPMRRQFAERQAINAPLQGSSADLIKKAMIAVHKKYGASLDVRMLLQVHDELVFEVKPENLEAAGVEIKSMMEKVATLKVPLVVDYNHGDNWDEAH